MTDRTNDPRYAKPWPEVDQTILWLRTTRLAVERGDWPDEGESMKLFLNGLAEAERLMTRLRMMTATLAAELIEHPKS